MKFYKAEEAETESLNPNKVVLVGACGAGKTTFLQKYMQEPGTIKSTVGVDFKVAYVTCKSGSTVRLQVWDTAGQERFHSLSRNYYQKANLFVLLVDLSSDFACNDLKFWLDLVKRNGPEDTPVLLVGNKNDENVVVEDQKLLDIIGDALPIERILGYRECSAKKGKGVDEAFLMIGEEIHKQILIKQNTVTPLNSPSIILSTDETVFEDEPRRGPCCGF